MRFAILPLFFLSTLGTAFNLPDTSTILRPSSDAMGKVVEMKEPIRYRNRPKPVSYNNHPSYKRKGMDRPQRNQDEHVQMVHAQYCAEADSLFKVYGIKLVGHKKGMLAPTASKRDILYVQDGPFVSLRAVAYSRAYAVHGSQYKMYVMPTAGPDAHKIFEYKFNKNITNFCADEDPWNVHCHPNMQEVIWWDLPLPSCGYKDSMINQPLQVRYVFHDARGVELLFCFTLDVYVKKQICEQREQGDTTPM